MGKSKYKNRVLDVRRDRLDLRDRPYRPLLTSLPKVYPNFADIADIIKCYKNTDMILDQGNSGACTGYALATVINYILWKDIVSKNYKEFLESPLGFEIKKVSQKMLFNLARIYDEWDSEDYEGSSCRGAMKGWYKHGVCQESYWEFYEDEPKLGWEKEAIERPLGAYYRVDRNSISDMQSAVCEVGALYVSASIHNGWWELAEKKESDIVDIRVDIPTIDYHKFPVGSHAFVIVGYTRCGFIIQNSWGINWGNSGFAILTYKDWLEHGMDAWVAVIGVPVDIDVSPNTYSNLSLSVKSNEIREGTKSIRKALEYNYKNEKLKPVSEEIAYQHTLVLNSYGRAKHTIIYTSSVEKSIDIICYENVKKWLDKKSSNQKVALYAFGGFKDEEEYISKIRVMLPYFIENGIYPIFLTWQNSYYKEIEESIEKFFQATIKLDGANLKEKDILQNQDALDRAIENHVRKISTRAIWSEIKDKALSANSEEIEEFNSRKKGALYILTDSFQKLKQEYKYKFELHAIAYSAGSQLLATEWLTGLADRGMLLHSLHLVAPTITIRDCNNYIIEAEEQALFEMGKIYIYLLDREKELKDGVSKYSKSLLFLISRALEKIHKTPLLGLDDAWNIKNSTKEDGIFNTKQLDEIKNWCNFISNIKQKCCKSIWGEKDNTLKSSIDGDFVKLSHKNLDKSIGILEDILKVINNGELEFRVEHLS